LDPGGGRLGRLTQAVMHTCSGNLGIVKIFKVTPHKQKSILKGKTLAGKYNIRLSKFYILIACKHVNLH
jgi:hypothetical protein